MEIQGRKNNGNGQEDRRRNEQKEDERRGERRKESVLVRFLRMPLFFLIKGKIGRAVVAFLGETLWRSLISFLIVILGLGRMCVGCLM